MARKEAIKEALELYRGPDVEPMRILTPSNDRKWCMEVAQAIPHIKGDRRKDLCLFLRTGTGQADVEQMGIVIAMWEGSKNNVQEGLICSVEDTQQLQFLEYVLKWRNYEPSMMIASKVNKPPTGKNVPTSAKGFGWILPSYESLPLSGIKGNRDILQGFSICRKALANHKKPPSIALKAKRDEKMPSRMDTNWLRASAKKRSVKPLASLGEPSTTKTPSEEPATVVEPSAVVNPTEPLAMKAPVAPPKKISKFTIKLRQDKLDDSPQPSSSQTPPSVKGGASSTALGWPIAPTNQPDLKFNPEEEKKMAEQTAVKLEQFKRFYPMGVNWFMKVSIFDCEPAPANLTHRMRSNDHVQTLVKSFHAYPTEVLTPADVVPFDPITRNRITWNTPEDLQGKKFYIISGNHSICAAQLLCGFVGQLQQQLEFAKAYARRRTRVLNGNLTDKEYIELSIQCNEVIANTVYKEPLIEKLQQLRHQHKAYGFPAQGPIGTATTSSWKDFYEVATTTLKVKDLKDEKQFIFLEERVWRKLTEVVTKWVNKKLYDDHGQPPEKPSKEFFNKTWLRYLRGMSNIELAQLLDEILEGKTYLKVQPGYSGRFDCKQRAIDIRTLTFMRREIISYASSVVGNEYIFFEDLLVHYPGFTEQRILDIAGTDAEYVRTNWNKDHVLGNMPICFLEPIRSILKPDEARKLKEKNNIVHLVTKEGIPVSATVSENATLAFIDLRGIAKVWDCKRYLDLFTRIASMTTAKVYHLVILLRSASLPNCLYTQSQIHGGSHISVGTYDELGWVCKRKVKEYQYYVTHMCINRSDARVLSVQPELDLRLNQLSSAPKTTPLPPMPLTGNEDEDVKIRKKYQTFFTGKPKYSWAAMDGDFVLKCQLKTSYAYHIIAQLVPQEACVLDFFSAGTASRVALMQGKRSLAFEKDDKICRFLRSFLETLEKMASCNSQEQKREADNVQEGDTSQVNLTITQGTDLSNLDRLLEGLDEKSYEERMQETKKLLEATQQGGGTFEYMGSDDVENDDVMEDETQEHQIPRKKLKMFQPTEFSTELERELLELRGTSGTESIPVNDDVQRLAGAMDIEVPVVTGYSEMDLSQKIELGKQHAQRIANEIGVTPDSVSETQ